jgi:hypothetical protein
MSYDPSHRRPPRQERWPNATPQDGWPAYVGGDGHRDDQAWADAGAFAGATSGRAAVNGYGAADGYDAAGRYGDTWDGYTETRNGYAPARDNFDGGYGGTAEEYAADTASHQWDGTGYGYDATQAGYDATQAGYGYATQAGYGGAGNGYGGGWEGGHGNDYLYREGYAEPEPATRSGPRLIAPDTIGERGWLPDRDEGTGRGQDRSGPIIGAVMGFLAAAVAIGVSTFAAAFVRPQASPIIAVGGAFIDRTPSAVKNFAVQHFGENDKTVLLGGMYVTIALIAMAIGCLARRNATIGVAGVAAFGLFGAFVAITRPEARVTDVMPSVIGGIAGVAAFLWLARAAAPVMPARAPARAAARTSSFRHAHPSGHRRAR